MKKSIFFVFIVVTLMFFVTGCFNDKKMEDSKINGNNINESEIDNNMETISNISININGKKYDATLEENETSQAFAKLLPQSFSMKELNGNEKYIYMDESLPVDALNPKHIFEGDIMLYGDNCLVIFYKSFDTSYSYTKIGHINTLPDLGDGGVIVKFEK